MKWLTEFFRFITLKIILHVSALWLIALSYHTIFNWPIIIKNNIFFIWFSMALLFQTVQLIKLLVVVDPFKYLCSLGSEPLAVNRDTASQFTMKESRWMKITIKYSFITSILSMSEWIGYKIWLNGNLSYPIIAQIHESSTVHSCSYILPMHVSFHFFTLSRGTEDCI